ncbi:MAG: hypothetical protein WCB90_05810 [Methanosarcina sp.]
MSYIKKICPTCGREFVVLKNVEEKAVYCTLKCFSEAQSKLKEYEISSLLPA